MNVNITEKDLYKYKGVSLTLTMNKIELMKMKIRYFIMKLLLKLLVFIATPMKINIREKK